MASTSYRKLHQQLDELEQADRERLSRLFEQSYGRKPEDADLTRALALENENDGARAQETDSKNSKKQKIGHYLRWGIGLFAFGLGLEFFMPGLIGRDGIGPDGLININPYIEVIGAALIGTSVWVFPWKKRPSSLGTGAKIAKFLVGSALVTGGAFLSCLISVSMASNRMVASFSQIKSNQDFVSTIFKTKTHENGEITSLAPDGETCSLFRSHMQALEKQPTNPIGHLFRVNDLLTGYAYNCLNQKQLFSQVAVERERAKAYTGPAFFWSNEFSDLVSDKVGISRNEWCMISPQWPHETNSDTRIKACAAIKNPSQIINHPVSFGSIKPFISKN